ncbi:MAG TPA: anti-CBASS Acb1 family protein, partial [Methanosarcina sp.]|nr:anti-CBASS Acb1 family protein [Methanosarcina sp.]
EVNMAEITLNGINGTNLGNELQSLLMADEIIPGEAPSYQLCKSIYLYHSLGAKMVETPVNLAMSQKREISIPESPETMVKEAFEREWEKLRIDFYIKQAMYIKRTYGISSVIFGAKDFPTDQPFPMDKLAESEIYFNVLDPLNTAGSLVLNQNPNAPDFLKSTAITAAGQSYHFSRSCVVINEAPIYIAYTTSAFGFVGRSVFQRALFPLKSFITSMVADDEIMKKAAVIVAKIKNPGSITDKIVGAAMAIKRNFIKEARNGNTINVSSEDTIETLDLNNVDKAVSTVRNNIIENIASSATMPPKLLLSDGYAGVLANGTEDYKQTMQYINGIREDMQPLYDFFDNIVQHRAWSPAFYKRIQAEFPAEYGAKTYEEAFYQFKNSFTAMWPSLMEESDSEKSKMDKVRLDAIIDLMEKMIPNLDPDNAASLIDWVTLNISSMKALFSDPLEFDPDALIYHLKEKLEREKQQKEQQETIQQFNI